ncbi:MAG TPA: hypothetical protein VGF50_04175 [Caulobacteraceae bacterium]|jgi:hypothetical protein
MKMNARAPLAVGVLLAAIGLGYGVGMTQANQPHMRAALADLNLAKGELQVAMRNKGGHRVAALNLTKQAIGEVEAGIAAGE